MCFNLLRRKSDPASWQKQTLKYKKKILRATFKEFKPRWFICIMFLREIIQGMLQKPQYDANTTMAWNTHANQV